VIEVAVCIQQLNRVETMIFNKVFEGLLLFFEITARIDDEAFVFFIINNIGIFLYGTECKNLDL
jgi:hypothetical protein